MIRAIWQKIWEIADYPNRAAQDLKEEKEAVIASIEAMTPIDSLLERYRPKITQNDLDAVAGPTPWPAAEVLGREIDRIDDFLFKVFEDNGLPLRARSRLIQPWLNFAWKKMFKTLNQRAFGDLDLPPFFTMHRGWLQYEDTRRERNGRSGYRGLQTSFHYSYRPSFQR